MSVETENVAEEIQQEESVTPHEEQSSQTEATTQTPEASSQSDKEYNFSQLRKSKEQLEQKVQELEGHIESISSKQRQPEPSEEDDLGIGEEDLAEGKHLRKVYQELKNLKKELQQEKLASIPDRLKSKFADFDQVVSKQNVEKLKKAEPELYATITSGSDLYAKGVSAYKALTALGYADSQGEQHREQVKSNQNRPVSAQAIKGQGALSESNIFAKGLTPELRKQLQEEMSQAVKAR